MANPIPMMKRSVIITLVLLLACASAPLHAAVKPNSLFSDGAVLQRDLPLKVWGTGAEGEKVTVSFQGQMVSTTARNGQWVVALRPLKLGPAETMTVAGENKVEIKNVLVGDVWICSGQSNMQFAVEAALTGKAAIAAADDPQLRLLTVPRMAKDEPQTETQAAWSECTSQSVPKFSAVAYFFGRDLRKHLNVPIGLISSNVGGTPAEAWTDKQTLDSNPLLKPILDRHAQDLASFDPVKFGEYVKATREKYQQEAEAAKAAGKPVPKGPRINATPAADNKRPSGLYNAMIAPLKPYAIKGAIWYQGESNVADPKTYQTLFPAMIGNWRSVWGQGDFPFLFVQIAPHKGMTPELREAQLASWKSVPKTGMVVITDLGDSENIHPKHKEPVGGRLALAARAIAYGEKLEYSGPVYQSKAVQGNKVVLAFSHVGTGLEAKGGELKGFEISGADHQYVPAQATVAGASVVVSSPSVTAPVSVRYGWSNVPDVNLWNKEGLPATPFRTE